MSCGLGFCFFWKWFIHLSYEWAPTFVCWNVEMVGLYDFFIWISSVRHVTFNVLWKKNVHRKFAAMTFKHSKYIKNLTVLTIWSFSMKFYIQLRRSKQNEQGYIWGGCRAIEITPGPICKVVLIFPETNQLWLLSDVMASHKDAAHSGTGSCLNQDLTYLFTVLNLNHYNFHEILKFFKVCAHAKIFSFLFFPVEYIGTCLLSDLSSDFYSLLSQLHTIITSLW